MITNTVAEVVREAIAQYLGETDPTSVKSTITLFEDKVANLERKLQARATSWVKALCEQVRITRM